MRDSQIDRFHCRQQFDKVLMVAYFSQEVRGAVNSHCHSDLGQVAKLATVAIRDGSKPCIQIYSVYTHVYHKVR